MEASLRPRPAFDSLKLQPKPGERVPVNSHSGMPFSIGWRMKIVGLSIR
jgi:hypothetical protein